ncbi:MAG: NUDIX domain-containing protein [Spirochaetes bacterium]|nr:NUDIX domain-containing protein [Spirochaetota bacterium]
MLKTKSAGAIVLNRENQVLVVNQNGNSWSLPKGHIDPNETAIEACKREVFEESGISDLMFIKDLGKYKRHRIALSGGDDKSELKIIYMFLFKTEDKNLNPIDTSIRTAVWIEPDKVSELLTHKKDKKFFEKYRHYIIKRKKYDEEV